MSSMGEAIRQELKEAPAAAMGNLGAPPTNKCSGCGDCKKGGTSGSHKHFDLEFGRILRSGRYFLRNPNYGRYFLQNPIYSWRSVRDGLVELLASDNNYDIQTAALARWRVRQQKSGLAIDTNEAKELKYVFNIFDDYFFRGILKQSTTLIWVRSDAPFRGRTTSVTKGPSKWVEIKIARPRRPDQPDYRSDADSSSIIATLLHEMCHAVFRNYGCRQCCRASGRGLTGHGVACLSLAFAVQQAVKSSFEGLGSLTLDVTETSAHVRKEVAKLMQHSLLTDVERLCRLARAHGGIENDGDANILAVQLLVEGWPKETRS